MSYGAAGSNGVSGSCILLALSIAPLRRDLSSPLLTVRPFGIGHVRRTPDHWMIDS